MYTLSITLQKTKYLILSATSSQVLMLPLCEKNETKSWRSLNNDQNYTTNKFWE